MMTFALSSVLTSLILTLGVAIPSLAWFIDREQRRARRHREELDSLQDVIAEQAATIHAYREMVTAPSDSHLT